MDVKSEFLNGLIQEEVYVEQPPGFESNTFPHHVFKLNKALYGLKQAPQAWHGHLSSFLMNNDFKRGKWIQLCYARIMIPNLAILLRIGFHVFSLLGLAPIGIPRYTKGNLLII